MPYVAFPVRSLTLQRGCNVAYLGKVILIVAVAVMLGGCTFNFKAKELEVQSETKDPLDSRSYELESIEFLSG